MSIERANHKRNTFDQAEARLEGRINNTLGTIERKRQLELSLKKKNEELARKKSMETLQKHQTYAQRVDKAHSDLKKKINMQNALQQRKESSSKMQQDQNRREFESVLLRKKQTDMQIRQQVDNANRRQRQLEQQFDDQVFSKKLRVDAIKNAEEQQRKQTQLRQKEIAMEKAKLQANIHKLRAQ